VRLLIAGCLLVCVLPGCSFNEGGVAQDAAGQVDDAAIADAMIDVDGASFDAATIDAPVMVADAAIPDATIPDAGIPDANLCAGCVDGIACTNDVCDPGTGACTFEDNCPGVTSCNVGTSMCDGDITFANGASYNGTLDTVLLENTPTVANGTALEWGWDTDQPFGSGDQEVGLIRFVNLFSLTRIPVGSTVTSAILTLRVNNGSGTAAGEVYEAVSDWDENTTWNSFGPAAGVQPADFGMLVAAAPAPACGDVCDQTDTVDVTTSLAKWALDDSTMRGWIFIPTSDDGMDVDSSEAAADRRPSLRVLFTVAPPAPTPAP